MIEFLLIVCFVLIVIQQIQLWILKEAIDEQHDINNINTNLWFGQNKLEANTAKLFDSLSKRIDLVKECLDDLLKVLSGENVQISVDEVDENNE